MKTDDHFKEVGITLGPGWDTRQTRTRCLLFLYEEKYSKSAWRVAELNNSRKGLEKNKKLLMYQIFKARQ